MQYKIPQSMGIEDKIVGPLTLRQLIILAVGFGISYVLFAVISKLYEMNIIEYVIIVLPGLLSAAIALIKINNINLSKFILLFLEFSIKPKRRMWDHRGISSIVLPDLSDPQAEAAKSATATAEETAMEQKTKNASNLRNLSQVLDSGGFEHLDQIEHGDMDESHDDDLVTQAYFGHKENETENMYWRTKEAHKKMLDHFASLPVTQLKAGTKEAEMAKQEIALVKQETESLQASVQTLPTDAASAKKGRKRNRSVPQPVRSDNQVNTTQKNQPTQYIAKEEAAPATTKPAQPKKQTNSTAKPAAGTDVGSGLKSGELHFEELKDGEIEINLD